MAETMVTGFKRLPRRAYLGGDTSYFGSRTHFQLATFYALIETPEIAKSGKKDLEMAMLAHSGMGDCFHKRKYTASKLLTGSPKDS